MGGEDRALLANGAELEVVGNRKAYEVALLPALDNPKRQDHGPADEHYGTADQSFRMSKTDLRQAHVPPHRDAIEAHLTIVFSALAVSRTVQNRTGLAVANVIKQLRPLRSATIAINGTTQTFAPDIPAERQTILEAINHRKFTH